MPGPASPPEIRDVRTENKMIRIFDAYWKDPLVRNCTGFGALIAPVALALAQIFPSKSACPDGPFILVFLLATLPGQLAGSMLDPIIGHAYRQSMIAFVAFVGVSMISDGLILGTVALFIRRRKQNRQQAVQATARKRADPGR